MKNDKKIIVRNNCLYDQPKTLNDIINETKSNFKFNLHLPCLYDNLEFEYDEFKYDQQGIYFLIDNYQMHTVMPLMSSILLRIHQP